MCVYVFRLGWDGLVWRSVPFWKSLINTVVSKECSFIHQDGWVILQYRQPSKSWWLEETDLFLDIATCTLMFSRGFCSSELLKDPGWQNATILNIASYWREKDCSEGSCTFKCSCLEVINKLQWPYLITREPESSVHLLSKIGDQKYLTKWLPHFPN